MKGDRLIFNTLDPDAPDSGQGVSKTQQYELVPGFLLKDKVIYPKYAWGKNEVEHSAGANGGIDQLGGFPVWS